MRDLITAAVRTGVATIVTAAAAWLAGIGIDFDAGAWEVALSGLAVAVVNLVLNRLQQRWPWIGQIVSLGLSKSTPTY